MVVVLALVAAGLSEELQLPFDVMPCRKIKHPADGAQSIGSVSAQETVLNPFTHDLPQDYIGHQIVMIRSNVQADDRFYHAKVPPLSFEGKTVILVDDGLATGSTMRAAVAALKAQHPARLVVAVPVAAPETCEAMRGEVDEVVCAHVPEPFMAVGQWYQDFSQTTDDEVHELLRRGREGVPRTNLTPPAGRSSAPD